MNVIQARDSKQHTLQVEKVASKHLCRHLKRMYAFHMRLHSILLTDSENDKQREDQRILYVLPLVGL